MRLILPLICLPFAAQAELRIVTDIAPVHSLVSQVMGDLGAPDVLVSGAASPHDFQFDFTQAGAVQDADLVIWVGPPLTPWLEDALDTLAPNATTLTLLDTDGWTQLEPRDWDDGHDHGDHDEEDHGHDDHDHGDHDVDPHAWLDPMVASAWTRQIAAALADADPDNAAAYAANADATLARLGQLDADISAQMAALPDAPFLVPHDAYQYFGARYGVPAAGTITLSDAQAPSPVTLADMQALVRDDGIVCVLSDPQSRSGWGDLVREGSGARSALADPMGTTIPVGPDHYDQTLRALAAAYGDCIGG